MSRVAAPTAAVASVPSAISAGDGNNCALFSGGTVDCWGDNEFDAVGNGTTTQSPNHGEAVVVKGLSGATAVSMGGREGCALLAGGTVKCWGSAASGNGQDSPRPVAVKGISGATAISAGDGIGDGPHVCALFPGGQIECWGGDSTGELGNGASNQYATSTPVAVIGISTAVAVSSGSFGACALLRGGTIKCWGADGVGQLGNGAALAPPGFSATPLSVTGISTAIAVSAGANGACALLRGGTIKCWGVNSGGRLGNPTKVYVSLTPVSVSAISTAIAVSTGGNGSCALLHGGTIKCWGSNISGQLGNGSKPYIATSATPLSVKGISTAIALSTGAKDSCALLAGGSVECWGDNTNGALGTGNISAYLYPYSFTPLAVKGI